MSPLTILKNLLGCSESLTISDQPTKKISKENLLSSLDKAMAKYQIAALTKKEDKTLYDYISNSSEIILDYIPTVLSPKKFFFPAEEVILEYTAEGKVSPKIESQDQILFGVRPCDMNGIKILDEAFAESKGDPNYLAKREKTLIIGIDCKNVCDDNSFCYKVGVKSSTGSYDLLLQDLGSEYSISAKTEKGQKFAKQYLSISKIDPASVDQFNKEKIDNFTKAGGQFPKLDQFPEIFDKNKQNKVWEEEGKKCLSCGSCILVCPTCYCFDVVDELALNLKTGERIRRWDACMLREFTEVAGGENFRETAKNRLKHRIMRKFNYLMKKHGQSVCTGCGRCVRACLADISPKDIAEKITS